MRQRFDMALSAKGIPFVEQSGWLMRGSANYEPAGVVLHHTAGAIGGGVKASLAVVMDGRPGIPGPLCNLYVDEGLDGCLDEGGDVALYN